MTTKKLTKRQIRQILDISIGSINFKYEIPGEINYDERNSCYESGCHEEMICRCSQIVSSSIEEFSDYRLDLKSAIQLYNLVNPQPRWDKYYGRKEIGYGKLSYVEEKTVERMLSQANIVVGSEHFEVSVVSGYYGQEIEGVYLSNEPLELAELKDQIADFLVKTPKQKTLIFLETVYGIPAEQAKRLSITHENVAFGKIVSDVPASGSLSASAQEKYDNLKNQVQAFFNVEAMVSSEWSEMSDRENLPVIECDPLVMQTRANQFSLIYGRDQIAKMKSSKKRKSQAVIIFP